LHDGGVTLPFVTHSPTDERVSAGHWTHVRGARPIQPVVLGCAVSAGLLALCFVWEAAFGHLGYLAEHSLFGPEMLGPRIALTVLILTGFMVGSHAYGRREIVRDVQDLGPLLHCSAAEHATLLREAESSDRRAASWIGSLAAIPIGLLVVTSRSPGVPYLLSDESWNHDLVWALGSNVLLFAILGRIAVQTFRANEFFSRIEVQLGPVDLLHPQALAPFARRGLRDAFLWIGGSSLASIIFVNQGFSWLTGLVIVGTLLLGTVAFLHPVRGLRRRIRAAKEAELERVRDAIRRAREELLGAVGDSAAAARLPGLLAYEHRIASVREWPLDPPQIARFGLMIAVGLGSWLGGALVGHLVDAFWR
jgi:hypothetical protein